MQCPDNRWLFVEGMPDKYCQRDYPHPLEIVSIGPSTATAGLARRLQSVKEEV